MLPYQEFGMIESVGQRRGLRGSSMGKAYSRHTCNSPPHKHKMKSGNFQRLLDIRKTIFFDELDKLIVRNHDGNRLFPGNRTLLNLD